MTFEQAQKSYEETLVKVNHYSYAYSLMSWDLNTIAPRKGYAMRGSAIATLAGEIFGITTSREYQEVLQVLEANCDKLSPILQRSLRLSLKEYKLNAIIPRQLYKEYVETRVASNTVWKEAKKQNDFSLFSPYLEKMVDYTRQFVALRGYQKHPYNTLLDQYEEGLTVETLDGIFPALRDKTVGLLNKIKAQDKAKVPNISLEKQRQISQYLLRTIGYDLEAGNLYETEHPFCSKIHFGDVRTTTHYHENEPLSSIFSVLHEGGHGIYEQNTGLDLVNTNLSRGASNGIHESQSRFWENNVGRSKAFWNRHFNAISAIAGENLGDSADAIYRTANHVTPSLIRIEADELTYNLHIIIRYELEKEIFSSDIPVEELPALWNAKYKEYLGVTPPTLSEGILQDTHWSSGSFGYFPTYALGNLYSAQFSATIERELGSLDSLIDSSDGLQKIKAWLTENIYQYGKLETPTEIIQRVTGEPLNPEYFVRYITNKVSEIYSL